MTKKQKLELTWIGKGIQPELEPRILIEDKDKSYGDHNSENMLIHGDNLLALKALEQDFAGKIKCIYIDPPYNTGQAFELYDDGLEHSIWLNLMSLRFKILKDLLREDGVFFCQLNDDEMAYGKVILDEIFGRNNFLNQVSAKMKQTSGASGGGEDKKLKKNIEYLLIYAKNKLSFTSFNPVYDETDLFEVIQEMRDEGKSWKYTRIIYSGLDQREFLKEITDGSGDPIKIFKHENIVYKTIKELMKLKGLTEEQCYVKYYDSIFRDTNAQSSIRTKVMEAVKGEGDFFSIDYVPRSGRNKNKLTTLYYKGNKCDLIAWLSDICYKKNDRLIKLEKAGTFWDGFPLNNLTKEGGVKFPNGKKPEALIKKVLDLSTSKSDIVLDSFLGSGTTAAVAQKMGRKWIGIELGNHCYTHCAPRLKKVCDGTDQGGISKAVNWKGGGGFKFYELAPSLLNRDKFGNYVISKEYNADMLAAAMSKHEGFKFNPDTAHYWKQGQSTEKDFIFTTTGFVTLQTIDTIHEQMIDGESLLVCCKTYQKACVDKYPNIQIKKIPKMLLGKCEFDRDDYSLNIVNMPNDPNAPEFKPVGPEAAGKSTVKRQKQKARQAMPALPGFDDGEAE